MADETVYAEPPSRRAGLLSPGYLNLISASAVCPATRDVNALSCPAPPRPALPRPAAPRPAVGETRGGGEREKVQLCTLGTGERGGRCPLHLALNQGDGVMPCLLRRPSCLDKRHT